MEKADLKGGCFVLPAAPGVNNDAGHTKKGGGPLLQVIGTRTGAAHLSQYALVVKGGQSPVYNFGSSDTLLFVISGHAKITISGKTFEAGPETGLYVHPGEAFQILPSLSPPPQKNILAGVRMPAQGGHDKNSATLLITVCPESVPEQLAKMPGNFDKTYPDRLVAPDPKKREEMGNRYYQVLVGKKAGSDQVTQFIGEIPKSKASNHHHLYEEALYVLSGEGFMWTEDVSAPVSKGSIIFLPKRQEHSLECTSNTGLRVVGHFYPASSPAENY